jgi:hypothetical protein
MRRAEKWWPQFEKLKQDEDEFAEQSSEDVRLHSSSFRLFLQSYSATFLAAGNFRRLPGAGST